MDLQTVINSQPPGGKIELRPGEFFGQVTIDRPLTVVGQGKATWIGSRTSPTIRIVCAGVTLHNVTVEAPEGPGAVAIEATGGTTPVLQDVVVRRGDLVGIPPGNIWVSATPKDSHKERVSYTPPPPLDIRVEKPDSSHRPTEAESSPPREYAPPSRFPVTQAKASTYSAEHDASARTFAHWDRKFLIFGVSGLLATLAAAGVVYVLSPLVAYLGSGWFFVIRVGFFGFVLATGFVAAQNFYLRRPNGLSRTIVPALLGFVSGCGAGLVAHTSWLLTIQMLPSSVSMLRAELEFLFSLPRLLFLGAALGVTLVIAERSARTHWLEVRWWDNKLSDISISQRAIRIGSRPDADLFHPSLAPLVATVSMQHGLVKYEDHYKEKTWELRDGDSVDLGPLSITLRKR